LRVTWNLPKPYWHPVGAAADTEEGGGRPATNDEGLDMADGKDGHEDTTDPDEGDHSNAAGDEEEEDVDWDGTYDGDGGGGNNRNISVVPGDDGEEFGESAY
jgi:hypothetical protein